MFLFLDHVQLIQVLCEYNICSFMPRFFCYIMCFYAYIVCLSITMVDDDVRNGNSISGELSRRIEDGMLLELSFVLFLIFRRGDSYQQKSYAMTSKWHIKRV